MLIKGEEVVRVGAKDANKGRGTRNIGNKKRKRAADTPPCVTTIPSPAVHVRCVQIGGSSTARFVFLAPSPRLTRAQNRPPIPIVREGC
jgi:ribosomal protein S8E